MKKWMMRATAVLLVMLMLTAPAALADLQRGDNNADVYDLQQLLFETGWLFELPDGVFGRNTEGAVRGFEEYAGLPVDGIADDQMIIELARSLESLNGEMGLVSDYFGRDVVGYFTGVPNENREEADDDGGMTFGECCVQSIAVDGSSHTDYCEKHHNMHVETYRILNSGDLVSVRNESVKWLTEVGCLYDQWAALLSGDAQGSVLANRATFLASVEAQRAAVTTGEPTEAMIIRTETSVCQTLRNQAAWLCGMIWEQQNGGMAANATAEQRTVVLNSSVIIDGNTIYYSGDIAGEGTGIYMMNADGSDRRMISNISASLKAISNGNLLVWHYDDGALKILKADGELETVFHDNCYAIASDGRFYFGGSSIADDGSDHQWLLSSDPEYHQWFYPVDVVDGYLYFLDANGGNMMMGFGPGSLPAGDVTLNRLNLESGNIAVLSGAGTCYLGIEDGVMYYTREDFDVDDENSGSTFTIEVDEGLYSLDLGALVETKIAEISDGLLTFEYYTLVQDGIVYGEYSNYDDDEPVYRVIRTKANGDTLPPLNLNSGETRSLWVEDGVVYGIQGIFTEDGENYSYDEYIVKFDTMNGRFEAFAMAENDALSYTEMQPRIAVVGNRIYFCVQDQTNGAESLKSMALDGGDVRTLAAGAPMY